MSFHPNDVVRRGRRASLIVIGVILVLQVAFFRTQVLAHSQWVMQSEENRLRQVPIPAPRGVIYDRRGEVIAENSVSYNVSMLVKNEGELKATMDRLSELIPMSRKAKEDAVRRYRRDIARPTAIFPDASFDQVAVLEEHRTDFPALIIQAAPKRYYPEGPVVGAFVGYTAEISENELATRVDSGYRPGQQIGKSGLELQYETVLRGREGSRFVEVDARNRIMREQGARPDLRAFPGDSLKTNIDLDLQRFVFRIFGDSLIGGAVAVDPQTGGVLAIHSAPGVDPNRWIGGIPPQFYDSLRADTLRRPLVNKALQGSYPPGSTWKLATSVIALEDNVVRWDERFPQACNGMYFFGNRGWKCWKPEGHGSLALAGAIAKSCDVYFYQLGLKLQLHRLTAGGVRLGFGKKTGIDLPSERTPSFPVKYQEYLDAKWGKGNWLPQPVALNMSIGQGENSQTLLTMAQFYAALSSTDGTYPELRVAKLGETKRSKLINLPPEEMDRLREALVGVVTGGTAAASAIQGVVAGGKTGTAQSGRWVNGEELDHAWYTGIAPAGKGQQPKIVVVVMLEYGGHGTRAAAIANKIIEHYLKVRTLQGELGDQG
ncbi:MAG TPA: penicillin-binding protein 2 [Gemmatimonadaceae bacterium]|nr:penicillin-binding protein 2 [Gemmatimonadaceae bacterium]